MKTSHKPFLSLHPRSARDTTAAAKHARAEAQKELDALLSVTTNQKRTKENTLEPFNRISIIISDVRLRASLFAAVHPNARIRGAAEKAQQMLTEFMIGLYLRTDIYEALRAVSPAGLDVDARRFRKKELLDFTLSGIAATPAVRKKIRSLVAQEIRLGQTFDRNIKNDVRSITASPAEYAGLPDDYIKAHTPDRTGAIRVSTAYPDYAPFMMYAKNENARKRLSTLYLNRGWPKNDRVLKQLLDARQKHAHLLGFADWADYITVDKMARSARTVQQFINRVDRVTKRQAEKDYAALLARKRADVPGASRMGSWELTYYDTIVSKEKTGLDAQEARHYFRFPSVRDGLFATTQKLFGLRYRKTNILTWHPDVAAYDVWLGKKVIGRFYLDPTPRAGKYGHAACFSIRRGITNTQLPEVALVTNFSSGLMEYDEVKTFFHEFGHLLHFILSGNQAWHRFSGFGTESDFIEVPSQLLEAWTLDYPTIKKFARHVKTNTPIPCQLAERLRRAQNINRAFWERRQLFLTSLSLHCHQLPSPRKANLIKLTEQERRKYLPARYPTGTHMYASFGHLNGYSAAYYTYLWSRAIAEDILSPFRRKGMYNQRIAGKYLQTILAAGGSRDANDLISSFLGRQWTLVAFQRWLQG